MTYYADSTTAENNSAPHASLWHRVRPERDGQTSLLFWLTVLGLGCVSLLSVTWLASFALSTKGSEKLLQVSHLLPKLNIIQGDRKATAFRMSEPEPSELAHPKERKTSAPDLMLPAVIDHATGMIVEVPPHAGTAAATPEPPVFVSLQPVEIAIPALVPPSVETCNDPVVYLQQCSSQPGDSPMIRNWKMLTMYSLLSAAAVSLAPPPVVLAEEKKDPPAKVVDEKGLKDLAERVAALENKKLSAEEQDAIAAVIRAELKKFEDGPLNKLKTDILQQSIRIDQQKYLIDQLTKKLDAAPASPSVDKAMLDALKGIREDIARWAPTKERKMMSPPDGPVAETGSVMLINFYQGELLFIINGVNHGVPGGSWKLIENVPAGALKVEVAADRFGLFNTQSATLAPGKTYKLTATPQR